MAWHGRSTDSETVYSRDERHGSGFLFESVSSTEKIRSWRLVIDLSSLNEYLTSVSFEMETLAKVKTVLQPGMWVTSLDLEDAYHHIPIQESSRLYLCFQVGGKGYIYLVLPFCLKTAPWAFTKVVKQLKCWTIAQQIILLQYLDDWLNAHRDRLKRHTTRRY